MWGEGGTEVQSLSEKGGNLLKGGDGTRKAVERSKFGRKKKTQKGERRA